MRFSFNELLIIISELALKSYPQTLATPREFGSFLLYRRLEINLWFSKLHPLPSVIISTNNNSSSWFSNFSYFPSNLNKWPDDFPTFTNLGCSNEKLFEGTNSLEWNFLTPSFFRESRNLKSFTNARTSPFELALAIA